MEREMRIAALSVMLLAGLNTTLAAQRSEPMAIKRGMTVRVMAQPHSGWRQGTVMSLDTARVVIQLAEPPLNPLLTLPVVGIDSVQRGRRTMSTANGATGAVIGAIAGGLALGLLTVASCDESSGDGGECAAGMIYLVPFGGIVGGIVGFLAGASSGPMRWETARLPDGR